MHGEADERIENSYFLSASKRPFGWAILDLVPASFFFLWNLGKFEIPFDQLTWPMESMHNWAVPTGQLPKEEILP